MRLQHAILLGIIVSACAGCQTLAKPATETQVDQDLVTRPTPPITRQEPTQHEPRPGFDQEPPKSQTQ